MGDRDIVFTVESRLELGGNQKWIRKIRVLTVV